MGSKKSIKFPDDGALLSFTGSLFGGRLGIGFDARADLLFAEELFGSRGRPLLLFASFSARYSFRRKSKSGSFKSSSRSRAKSVEACLSFGIAKRVASSKCLATPRKLTTSFVCAANVLYIRRARSLSGRDISK